MANRKRKGRDISGWLCLDKAVGQTSTAAVGSVKRLFDAAKVGHAGTLDPLASGILPIAFGGATKTVPFVQDSRKLYRFTVQWGTETDTDDSDGTVVETSDLRPDRAAIEARLGDFLGEIMQRPPAFSAIKIAGARAYDLARDGETVEIDERPVVIHRFELTEVPDADHAVFEAECGKGTYVRALARDMGRKLGALGHVVALRRLAVGPFTEATAITIADVIKAREEGPASSLDRFLLPIATALGDLPEVVVGQRDAAEIMRGGSVLVRGNDLPIAGSAQATVAGRTIAIGEIEHGEFHPRRVFRA
ncbi:tRNA pseudouridine(55) synthase TruB [Bauldia litoralis]|uniref:tRNA pseudouridine synthase B n=1 Tax=Bauldia litoralis TaxID=665467 RepID=A0A1G6E0M3_9HYPH|nr:tRNA pseudouridine(55) synthase TruB [Bauldia litoralis]SDB51009.1 tRNA pseudouridine55 synthase [Bauldia litoralis]